jgi:hypothetical protein
LGKDILYECDTKHVPSPGQWIKLPTGLYVVAKAIYIYSAADDLHTANIFLDPMDTEFLSRLLKG